MSEHAYLPPSGAATWVRCAAAPAMWARFPERGVDKSAAEEGTAAHWVFAELFAGRFPAVGVLAPNGVAVTEEMIEGATLFIETAMQAWGIAPGAALHVEERIAIPSIHAANDGTPDLWFYDSINHVIYLFDYKFGHGYVDEFENWQMVDYVAGIIDALDLDGLADQHTRVVMTIVQPRCYHSTGPVRSWRVMASDLRPYFNTLRSAALAAVSDNPPATTNDGCTHCSGRHACQAVQRSAYQAAEISLQSLPDEMTPAARGLELHYLRRAADRLKARISGLEDSVREDLMRGEQVPFFAVEQSVGRLAWSVQPAEVLALGRMLAVDLAKPDVLTPTQAKEKLKKAGHDPALIAGFATNPPGAMKLAAVNSKTARKVFQK